MWIEVWKWESFHTMLVCFRSLRQVPPVPMDTIGHWLFTYSYWFLQILILNNKLQRSKRYTLYHVWIVFVYLCYYAACVMTNAGPFKENFTCNCICIVLTSVLIPVCTNIVWIWPWEIMSYQYQACLLLLVLW